MTGIETTIGAGLVLGGAIAGVLGKMGVSRWNGRGSSEPLPDTPAPPPELTPGRADMCIAHETMLGAMNQRFDGLEGWMRSIDEQLKKRGT